MVTRSFFAYASAILFTAASHIVLCAQAPDVTAAQPLNLPTVTPAADCSTLAAADISPAVGAPTHITAAFIVSGGKPAPYCKVLGYVEPAIEFEVHLPVSTWTQRLVQTGCGGLCGVLNIRLEHDDGCQVAQNGELALASTDMGHSGGIDGKFGAQDYQLRIDFAYRGVHLTTLAAKALIVKYYGQAPKFSYFAGCSDGGREALMEAERFPEDFNGITAGAPAMNFTTQNTFYHGWNALMNTGADGKPILTADKLPLLHQAVLAQCDAADRLKDGVISDPLACHPDLSQAECKPGQDSASCLTPAQVHAAYEIYKGAHDADGGKLVLSGPLPGSELGWAGVFVPFPGQSQTLSAMSSTGILQNLAYETNPPEGYTLANLRFDRATFNATTQLHGLYDATDPDLRPFAAAGGKLILWHGLADPHISPLNTIAYYTAMEKLMGAEALDRFARLYLFPGGDHCGNGEGPFNIDLLTPIMAWVERGAAPFALIASHVPGGSIGVGPGGPPNGGPPLAVGPAPGMPAGPAAKADRARPVFPYPLTAKYSGAGSIDDASSFVQGPEQPVSPSLLNWFGSGFYAPGYKKWCTATGTIFHCKGSR